MVMLVGIYATPLSTSLAAGTGHSGIVLIVVDSIFGGKELRSIG